MMQRRTFVLGLPLALAACGEKVWAPDDFVARAAYRHDGPPRLTLFTMKNVGTDNGAHTGLMINASQRVLWDPAGSFGNAAIPERNDVVFGITPRIEQFYISFHSRETFYTVIQEKDVPATVAEKALTLAIANGAVGQAGCARATSGILRQLPGFESIRPTLFPNNLAESFGGLPGVRTRTYHEDDADDKTIAAAEIDRQIKANQ